MSTHLLQNQRVIRIEAHSRGNLRDEFNTDIGMVTWAAFTDVVQERSDNEKIGAINTIN